MTQPPTPAPDPNPNSQQQTPPTPPPYTAAPNSDPQYVPSVDPVKQDRDQASLATFLNIIMLIPALVFYYGVHNKGPLTTAQTKENLNWTLTAFLGYLALVILGNILGEMPAIGWLFSTLGWLGSSAIAVLNLVLSILGGTKVREGQLYTYPWKYTFIK